MTSTDEPTVALRPMAARPVPIAMLIPTSCNAHFLLEQLCPMRAHFLTTMKIVCSTNMPFAKEAFGTLGDTVILPERTIRAEDVRDADILAIRSTTKVDAALLAGSRVRFVGTATIGTNHMDIRHMEERGIAWCAAPGCNANSVSEYMVAVLLSLARRRNMELAGRTIGVIGVGKVGSLVAKKARTLGMRPLLNDPPRARAGGQDEHFITLDQLLGQSDIVTLHVPLTGEGPDATVHMADSNFFSQLKRGAVFINCARGAVVDTGALLAALADGRVSAAVIDTWEDEPAFSKKLLDRADIGTPHIAGHSFEGKVMGTMMVYGEACRFLGTAPSWTPDAMMPPPVVPEIAADAAGRSDLAVLHEIISAVYDVEADDRRLRDGSSDDPAARASHFDRLRRNYPMRREFRFTRVLLKNASAALRSTVAGLGFGA